MSGETILIFLLAGWLAYIALLITAGSLFFPATFLQMQPLWRLATRLLKQHTADSRARTCVPFRSQPFGESFHHSAPDPSRLLLYNSLSASSTMADDSGLMDWSPDGIAHDLNTAQPYYRELAMPGGFPLTPSRPSTPVFKRIQAEDASIIPSASKRLCTTAARASSAASTVSASIISILRGVKEVQKMQFRFRKRTPQVDPESRAPRSGTLGDGISTTIQNSKHPPVKTGQEAEPVNILAVRPTLRSKTRSSESITTSGQHIRKPSKLLASPFPILQATYGMPSVPAPSLASSPSSSPARKLATQLDAADDDSDSTSNSLDGKWTAYRTPSRQVRRSLTNFEIDLSSAIPDTRDWYHDPINGWVDNADLTGDSLTKTSNIKSIDGLKIEDLKISSARTRQALAKAKIDSGDTAKFAIKPLSKQWEIKVDVALKNGHGRLQARDFQKIVPPKGKSGIDAWLNDESINEYLNLVTTHANKGLQGKTPPRMHAFSTFFFTSLKTGGYQKVARWAKRAKIAGAALLDVEKIFIPVNPNSNHWTLAVIEPKNLRITHYNSLGNGCRAYLELISEWLKGELGAGFIKDDWELDFHAESPQQMNGSDCGVFTVTTAKQIMLGVDPMSYGAKDIPTQRRRMIAELVNGELLQNS